MNKFLNLSNFSFVTQKKKVLKVFKDEKSGSYGDSLYVNNKLIKKKNILKGKIKFILLNNIVTDFLIKFTNISFLKRKVKEIFHF